MTALLVGFRIAQTAILLAGIACVAYGGRRLQGEVRFALASAPVPGEVVGYRERYESAQVLPDDDTTRFRRYETVSVRYPIVRFRSPVDGRLHRSESSIGYAGDELAVGTTVPIRASTRAADDGRPNDVRWRFVVPALLVVAGLLGSVLPFLFWHAADGWFGLPARERPWLLSGASPLALGIPLAAAVAVAATFAWASWIPAVLLGDPATIDSEVRRPPAPGQLLSRREAWSAKIPFCGARAATALVLEAIEHGRRDDLRRYLAAAREPALRFPIELRGVDYLGRAAREGDVDAVRLLLDAGIDPRADASALPGAVEGGRGDILRLLAERGATPARPEEVREDPWKDLLSTALRARQDDALVALVELGWVDARATANPDAWGGGGSLLDVALIRGLPRTARALQARGAATAAPILAPLLEGDLAGMRAILPEREWSAARPFGAPLLSFAARAGQLAVVRRLLELGADPAASARIEPGDPPATALDEAARRGHLEVAKHLAAARGAAHAASSAAVAAAAEAGRWELVRVLVDAGARPEGALVVKRPGARNVGGATPLHRAAYEGNLEMVEYLLAHGADPRAEAEEKLVPIELARDDRVHAALARAGGDPR